MINTDEDKNLKKTSYSARECGNNNIVSDTKNEDEIKPGEKQ